MHRKLSLIKRAVLHALAYPARFIVRHLPRNRLTYWVADPLSEFVYHQSQGPCDECSEFVLADTDRLHADCLSYDKRLLKQFGDPDVHSDSWELYLPHCLNCHNPIYPGDGHEYCQIQIQASWGVLPLCVVCHHVFVDDDEHDNCISTLEVRWYLIDEDRAEAAYQDSLGQPEDQSEADEYTCECGSNCPKAYCLNEEDPLKGDVEPTGGYPEESVLVPTGYGTFERVYYDPTDPSTWPFGTDRLDELKD